MGVEEVRSQTRSQNGCGVRVQESADFVQRSSEAFGIAVSKVLGEDQKVAALLDGSLGHIHESCLVRFAATTEPLGDVGWNGYRCTTHLQTVIEDLDLPNPVIRSHDGHGFAKQYVRDDRILRTEPATNETGRSHGPSQRKADSGSSSITRANWR